MKLLIGGSPSKLFHLEEFSNSLQNIGVECKLVLDSDYADGFPGRKFGSWFKTDKKFESLIEEFKPDVIFVDRQRHFGLASTKMNIPLLVHLRGNHWEELKMAQETLYKSPPKKLVLQKWKEIAEECFQGSKIILPICNHLSEITKKRYPGKPIETMYQGITPSNWYQTEGLELKHPCVGILQSATIWEKTKELLILPKILQKMPNVHFYWAGDGVYSDNVLPVLEKFKNFHWLGALDYPDKVREFLTEIDVYALISGIDMSPLTLQEAQLMEKPVIATNVGGVPELMKDAKTGFLVTKNNSEELTEKISVLINDTQKSKSMGKNGKDFVTKNFNWDKISHDFLDSLKKYNLSN